MLVEGVSGSTLARHQAGEQRVLTSATVVIVTSSRGPRCDEAAEYNEPGIRRRGVPPSAVITDPD